MLYPTLAVGVLAALAIIVPLQIGGIASQHLGRMLHTDRLLVVAAIKRPSGLAVGDSRIERAVQSAFGPELVLGGYGGARIGELVEVARALCRVASPKRVVLAVGLNDARDLQVVASTLHGDANRLLQACPKAKSTVLAVWPAELDREPYAIAASAERIALVNRVLHHAARRHGARFVLPPAGTLVKTTDGLHFSPESNQQWSAFVAREALQP